MKFEQMQYARPDFDAARETFASLRARIAAAPDAQAQLEAFREFETLSRHISTMSNSGTDPPHRGYAGCVLRKPSGNFDATGPALGEAPAGRVPRAAGLAVPQHTAGAGAGQAHF